MKRALLILLALAAVAPAAHAAVRGKVTASSVKTDDENPKIKYVADRAVDGSLKQSWAEGVPGYGEGSWLELDLGQVVEVRTVNLWGGNLSQGAKSFKEFSRPRKVKLTLSGGPGAPVEQEIMLQDRMQRFDHKLDAPVAARKLKIEVLEVYEGIVFSDLHLAEVAVNFGRSASELEDWVRFLDSAPAQKLAEEHAGKVKDAFYKINSAEFGDAEALAWLMDEAGDGASWQRAKVATYVDVGFRIAAVRPDLVAIDALRKLKDANAIPAIEMAMLRSWGKEEAELQDLVEIFYAYQELIGGRNLNIPYWGQTGWQLGAIRSFGEPVPIEINTNGDLYVADIGNNRVQMFSYEGKGLRQWGNPEPDITNAWFAEGRKWYVSGAAPGDKNNQFTQPLDVELIAQKETEWVAVLDYTMRVQLFDAEGRPLKGWPVSSSVELDPGVGGEGYLAWVPQRQRLYVILGNEMIAYDLDAQELGRWRLEDGTPNAVEVSKKGKLYMAFGRDIVLYDVDGFRHGVIWGTEQLGEGYEDLDITLDEDDAIWIVTDQGWAFKYKNQRKLEYKVRFSKVSLVRPRIAAQEDILYCVDRDRIIRLDAMQAKLDAEQAAQDAADEAAREAQEPL